MSKVHIGDTADGKHISLDLEVMLTTRLLVTADSGGGKTFLLKRLCEQAASKIQIIIVDPEGEFSPLREKLPFVLAGKGGETPADIRSAAKLAVTLLQTRASAVCDLYEMKASERHAWVRTFLDALIEAPKQLRHPCLVIVDEAHMFCPEKGKGESEASDSMKALCTRGRKRLLCAIFATQRLAELDKGASSMLLNRLVGPTFEDVNRKRAAETLSIASEDLHEFKKKIQLLEPGNFYALGRAISKDLVLVKVGAIETPHGDDARKYELEPPPPPEDIRALLPKLADLPKAAEEEARTVADYKKQIRELKAQLRAMPTATKEVRVADPEAIERAVRQAEASIIRQARESLDGRARAVISTIREFPNFDPKRTSLAGEIHKGAIGVDDAKTAGSGSAKTPRPYYPPPAAQSNGDGELKPAQMRILRAIGEFEAIGRQQISKSWIAVRAGASPTSGAYFNNLGALRSGGWIEYPGPDLACLTDKGRGVLGLIEPPKDSEEMLKSCLNLIAPAQQKILQALYEAHPRSMEKETLAETVGASPTSGAFFNNLGALRTAGMIEYPGPGTAKCADWMFLE